jgi:hypothetical protein
VLEMNDAFDLTASGTIAVTLGSFGSAGFSVQDGGPGSPSNSTTETTSSAAATPSKP